MKIYERIKFLRKERGLTADTVAEAIGVSRATVYRYESKDIENMPITILEPLAKVLHCTPAYLMGWEDTSDSFFLASLEKQIIERYRQADEISKAMVLRALSIDVDFSKKEGSA